MPSLPILYRYLCRDNPLAEGSILGVPWDRSALAKGHELALQLPMLKQREGGTGRGYGACICGHKNCQQTTLRGGKLGFPSPNFTLTPSVLRNQYKHIFKQAGEGGTNGTDKCISPAAVPLLPVTIKGEVSIAQAL